MNTHSNFRRSPQVGLGPRTGLAVCPQNPHSCRLPQRWRDQPHRDHQHLESVPTGPTDGRREERKKEKQAFFSHYIQQTKNTSNHPSATFTTPTTLHSPITRSKSDFTLLLSLPSVQTLPKAGHHHLPRTNTRHKIPQSQATDRLTTLCRSPSHTHATPCLLACLIC